MKKSLIIGFIFVLMIVGFVSAQTSDAKTFYIDDTFKVGWTDGTDNYEAEYKVWKIEEQQGENITIFTLVSGGGIAFHSLDRHFISLGSTGKLIINEIYVSGDDKWISITLENAEFKEESTFPNTPSPSSSGGGDTCTKYYTCSDGTQIKQCELSGTGCLCKSISSLDCPPEEDEGDTCTKYYTCLDGSKVKECEISSNGMCGCKSNPTSLCPSSSNTYFKSCSYIWDSSNYLGQKVKITSTITDSTGDKDSDSIDVDVVENVIGGGGGGYLMDGKTLDIQINQPSMGEVAGAVEIKISSKGPNELGEMSLSFGGENWAGGFEISNKNCVSGGSSGGSEHGVSSKCEKYHICDDGSEIQYCEIIKQYDNDGNIVGAGCGCKQNPEELCASTSSSSGSGGEGKPIPIPLSSSSGGGGGSNETPIICRGCILGDKCAPISYRVNNKYCDIGSEFIEQVDFGESCENNFECESNVCISGECISEGLMKKILNWFKRLFGGE